MVKIKNHPQVSKPSQLSKFHLDYETLPAQLHSPNLLKRHK